MLYHGAMSIHRIGMQNGCKWHFVKCHLQPRCILVSIYNLFLNLLKTKELVFGAIVDKNLNWSEHAKYVINKYRQIMYLLYVLTSFNVNSTVLYLFYLSTIASMINYNFIIWWNSTSQHNKMLINGIYRKAINSDKFEVTQTVTNYKKTYILKGENSVYHEYYQTMRSGKRLRSKADQMHDTQIPQ